MLMRRLAASDTHYKLLHGGLLRREARVELVAGALVVLLATLFHHAILGMQVVIEDYVGHEGAKFALLVVSRFGLVLAGVLGIVAVLKISLGA